MSNKCNICLCIQLVLRKSQLRVALSLVLITSILGCGLVNSPPSVSSVNSVIASMVATAAKHSFDSEQTSGTNEFSEISRQKKPVQTVALLGFRDVEGRQSDRTEVLDASLVSAAVHTGIPLARDNGLLRDLESEGPIPLRWSPGQLWPRNWEQITSSRFLSGQVRYETPWAYIRLVLMDRVNGTILWTTQSKVLESELEQRGRAIAKARGEVLNVSDFSTGIDFHLLVRRVEGQFPQLIDVTERGALRAGDKLQLRFRVDQTCAVYAFLQQSNGQREDIISSDRVYGGRLQYGPGEESWIDLDKVNEVYTLYFIVAERLRNERREDLYEAIDELVQRGQLNRFEGIEMLDVKVTEFLQNQIENSPPIEVLRSGTEIRVGQAETFVYSNGDSFESVPELLSATPILVRAYTFEVQYN